MGVLSKLKAAVTKAAGSTDAVYFPGCTTHKYLGHIAENYKSILTDLSVPVRTVEPFCCGRPLKEQGYSKDYQEHLAKTKKHLEQQGVRSIITNCASCMQTLEADYGLTVRHTSDVIAEHKRKLQPFNEGEVTFQDNCIAARSLGNTNQPREVLIQTGFRIKEFSECKAGVRCCGGSCGLGNNAATAALKLGQKRVRDAPADTIVTDDPYCYLQLKRTTQNKEVLELSETLVEI